MGQVQKDLESAQTLLHLAVLINLHWFVCTESTVMGFTYPLFASLASCEPPSNLNEVNQNSCWGLIKYCWITLQFFKSQTESSVAFHSLYRWLRICKKCERSGSDEHLSLTPRCCKHGEHICVSKHVKQGIYAFAKCHLRTTWACKASRPWRWESVNRSKNRAAVSDELLWRFMLRKGNELTCWWFTLSRFGHPPWPPLPPPTWSGSHPPCFIKPFCFLDISRWCTFFILQILYFSYLVFNKPSKIAK